MAIDKTNFPAMRGDVSVTLHPDTVATKWTVLDADGTLGQNALMAGISAARAVYTGQAEALDARKNLAKHVEGVPQRTAQGYVVKHGFEREYADGVKRIRERAEKSLNSYTTQVANACDSLRTKVESALKDRSTPATVQAEVRNFIRSMSRAERMRFVLEQPLSVYAAVKAAPAFLSGLDAQQIEVIDIKARQRFCPQEQAQFDAVHELFGHLVSMRQTFLGWADKEIKVADTPAVRAIDKVKALGR